jgi:hypothetical protein
VRAAGLASLRPHDLRHTAVVLWIAAGANPKEVSVRAGHTSVSFTLDRYGHLFPGHDAELRDRLDAMHAEGLQGAIKGTVVELSQRVLGWPDTATSSSRWRTRRDTRMQSLRRRCATMPLAQGLEVFALLVRLSIPSHASVLGRTPRRPAVIRQRPPPRR